MLFRSAKAENREEVTKAYVSAIGTYLEERDKQRDKIIIAQAIEGEKSRLESLARRAAGLGEKPSDAPPARPPSGGGSRPRPDSEVLLDPKTPVAELDKILKRRESGVRQ